MRRLSIIITALVLVLGLTQCKKSNDTDPTTEGAKITLVVEDGAKADVNPGNGAVTFKNGDVIYVGSGGKYVGTLTRTSDVFSGNLSNPVEGQPLYFYFLGNVTPTINNNIFTVSIIDQTTSLPVISCGTSTVNYSSSISSYSAVLMNKCALVKFDVTTSSTSATCIMGMNNKMTIDFSTNTFTPSKGGSGLIKLTPGSGEKWAILLPQAAVGAGSAHSSDGRYAGTCGSVPAIEENDYLTSGIAVAISAYVSSTQAPTGAIKGLFTVNANGDQVYFSKGNLQYRASTNVWRFATNQWDFVAQDNTNISQYYNGWIDLFGWGTSGYDHGAVCYQPWSTSTNYSDYYAYGWYSYNLYDKTGQADWGYNPISNGGNTDNQWRTLSYGEWKYIFETRNTNSGIRFAKAIVNDVNGLILLPDDWNCIYNLNNTDNGGASYNSNSFSASQWGSLENAGAVFLPAANQRSGTSYWNGSEGYYRSASYIGNYDAIDVYFSGSQYYTNWYDSRSKGHSVRLVQDAE